MGRGRLLAAGALIIALLFSGWDQIQAWRLLQGETVTIVPDPSLEAETVQESLRVVPHPEPPLPIPGEDQPPRRALGTAGDPEVVGRETRSRPG